MSGRFVVLAAATLASLAGVGGCSWLLGVSDDPVVADLSTDAADASPDARLSVDSASLDSPPDVPEAAVDDAPVD